MRLCYNRNITALRQKEGKLLVYQAFYRVYRPQSFAEMSGQQHVKQTLQTPSFIIRRRMLIYSRVHGVQGKRVLQKFLQKR